MTFFVLHKYCRHYGFLHKIALDELIILDPIKFVDDKKEEKDDKKENINDKNKTINHRLVRWLTQNCCPYAVIIKSLKELSNMDGEEDGKLVKLHEKRLHK